MTVSLEIAGVAKSSPFRTAADRFVAGKLGMSLFLISLAVLFVASLVGYSVIRLNLSDWPRDLPPLPASLLFSTTLLLVSSGSLHGALVSTRHNLRDQAAWLMAATCALAAGFLIMQAFAWSGWLTHIAGRWEASDAHRWALTSFFVLTGLHALHVIGGLVPMALVAAKSWRGLYTPDDYAGMYYCGMYWHFLGGVWLVLYPTLLIGT